MQKDWQSTTKCLFKIGWIVTVEEVTTGVMCCNHGRGMMSVSISMKTRPAVCTKPSPTNALHSLGGTRIWCQTGRGTRQCNCVRVCANPMLESFHSQSSKVTWTRIGSQRKDSEFGPIECYSTGNRTRRLRGHRIAIAGSL